MKRRMVILEDAEMAAFLDKWIASFADSVREAWPDPEATRKMIGTHLHESFSKSMGPYEVSDYFYISHPGIIGDAIDDERDHDAVARIFEAELEVVAKEYWGD